MPIYDRSAIRRGSRGGAPVWSMSEAMTLEPIHAHSRFLAEIYARSASALEPGGLR
jgi:hypothetical protein